MILRVEPDDQCYTTLVWVQIDTTGLERHSDQAFKMFMPFTPLLGIYPEEIILDVGKHLTLQTAKILGTGSTSSN